MKGFVPVLLLFCLTGWLSAAQTDVADVMVKEFISIMTKHDDAVNKMCFDANELSQSGSEELIASLSQSCRDAEQAVAAVRLAIPRWTSRFQEVATERLKLTEPVVKKVRVWLNNPADRSGLLVPLVAVYGIGSQSVATSPAPSYAVDTPAPEWSGGRLHSELSSQLDESGFMLKREDKLLGGHRYIVAAPDGRKQRVDPELLRERARRELSKTELPSTDDNSKNSQQLTVSTAAPEAQDFALLGRGATLLIEDLKSNDSERVQGAVSCFPLATSEFITARLPENEVAKKRIEQEKMERAMHYAQWRQAGGSGERQFEQLYVRSRVAEAALRQPGAQAVRVRDLIAGQKLILEVGDTATPATIPVHRAKVITAKGGQLLIDQRPIPLDSILRIYPAAK